MSNSSSFKYARTLVVILAIAVGQNPLFADRTDDEVVASTLDQWKRAGFEVYWVERNIGWKGWHHESGPDRRLILRDSGNSRQKVSKLAEPSIPFEISGYYPWNDADVAALTRMPQLRGLSLNKAKLTDEGIKAIGQLTNLESLRLEVDSSDFSHISHQGYEALANLKSVKHLHIDVSGMTDEDFKPIGMMDGLKTLEIVGNANFTGKGFSHLGNLTQLESMQITGMRFTVQGWNAFTKIKPLKSLTLYAVDIPQHEEAEISFGAHTHLEFLTTQSINVGQKVGESYPTQSWQSALSDFAESSNA